MLTRQLRLTTKRDITTLLRKGAVVRGDSVSIRLKKNNLSQNRFGFIFSRKEIKKATERNLLKRRTSEILKELIGESQEGYDVLFIFSHNATKLSFRELHECIRNILQEIK